jgi:hypothetical protein
MLTGFPPFSTENRNELFDLIRYGVIEYPSGVNSFHKEDLTKIAESIIRIVSEKS